MIHAVQLKDNTVINRAVFRDIEDVFEDWYISETAQIGWIKEGEDFIEPTISAPTRTADDTNTERKAMIDAGCYVNGVLFDADSNAQIAYMGFEKALQFDQTYSTSWKASSGVWVTMNATLYAQVVPVILAHVAACFAWQKEQEQLLLEEQ